MYTQCPECGTVFRVTAPVLRAAQGQVRCGVCDTSFDALRFLSDDIDLEVNAASASRIAGAPPEPPQRTPPPATRNRASADEERALGEIAAQLARGAPPAAAPRPAPARPAAAPAAPASATQPAPARPGPAVRPVATPPPRPPPEPEEINVLEPSDVEDIVIGAGADDIPDASLEFDLRAADWEQVFVKDPTASAVTPLDLDLERPGASEPPIEAPDELVLLEDKDDPLARTDEYQTPDFTIDVDLEGGAAGEFAIEPAEGGEFVPLDVTEPAAARAAPAAEAATPIRPQRRGAASAPAPFGEEPEAPAPRAALAGRLATRAGVALLALALVAQVVHYYREPLSESPLVGPALSAFYARIGLPVEQHWDLAGYDVRQWGAQSEETAGVLRLRASIVNRLTRGQPYPLLRVTLEDRFGSRVGRREFTPSEYLPGRAAPRGLLAPGARADADLSLADPGNQAVGFELDVCLVRHGALACGADAKAGG